MSHSANVGLDRALEIGLSFTDVSSSAAWRSWAATAPAFWRSRAPYSITATSPVSSAGRLQPRFTLATRSGIGEKELGALGGGIGGDASPRWGTSPAMASRGTARPARLATFSA